MIKQSEVVIRLILSAIIGGLIGMEREVNNRPAGLRTHVLVTLGSTLIMLVSIDGFYDAETSLSLGDPARLAAQVVSGIGFLGAGTIMRTGGSVKGLTTAASLWVCAGIGLSIGSGYYLGGLLTAAIVLVTLMSLRFLEKRVIGSKYRILEVVGTSRPGLIGEIGTLMGEYNISIRDISIIDNDIEENENGGYSTMEIHFLVKVPTILEYNEFIRELNYIKGIYRVGFQREKI